MRHFFYLGPVCFSSGGTSTFKSYCATYATLGICHSVWMTVYYAGWKILHQVGAIYKIIQ
jgi:hypothetical protein